MKASQFVFMKRKTSGEVVFNGINMIIMILICFITLYPIWYVVIHSFNDGADSMLGGVFWWPRVFTLDNYREVFRNSSIVNAFAVSIMRTIIGTLTNVFFTAMVAYGLSKTRLIGRKLFLTMGTVTMFFSGGLIPTYLLLKNLGLLDNFWVYIFPSMFNFFNAIIFINFFKEIPPALEESAGLDGANDLLIFVRIILPLSKPVLATIALFTGVYHWNDYFSGVIFINTDSLQPIQTFLYRIVSEAGSSQMIASMPAGVAASKVTSLSIRLATMVATTFPIVCVYPFLQKYFVKGIMIGSVKG